MEKKLPLTKAQRAAIRLIAKTEAASLRNHIKPSGTAVFRLMDAHNNPVKNFRRGVIQKLISKQYLEINGGGIVKVITEGDS